MQELIKKLNDKNISEKERKIIYSKIMEFFANNNTVYFCVLDPRMILEDTSIPYIIKTNGVCRALIFSKMNYAVEWCKHYNLYYNGNPLAGKLTSGDFYRMLAVSLVNGIKVLSIDNGQTGLELYIPDIFKYTGVRFSENIVMPRVEI